MRLLSSDSGWIDLIRFALLGNLTTVAAAELWRSCELVCVGAGDASFDFGRESWRSLVRAVQRALAAHHHAAPDTPDLEPNRLRAALDLQPPVDVFFSAIGAMTCDGALHRDGPCLKLAGDAVRSTSADQRLWERIRPITERAGFQPPRVRDFAQLLRTGEDEVRQLMRRLSRMGLLVEIAHHHLYDRAVAAELARIAHRLAGTAWTARLPQRLFAFTSAVVESSRSRSSNFLIGGDNHASG